MIGYYPELHTEYARRKDIECYDLNMVAKQNLTATILRNGQYPSRPVAMNTAMGDGFVDVQRLENNQHPRRGPV